MSTVQIDKSVIERAIDAIDKVSAYGRWGSKDVEQAELQKSSQELRAALAAQEPAQAVEPEPVAWMSPGGDVSRSKLRFKKLGFTNLIPLYTHPAPAKPLSDDRQHLSKVLAAVREYLPPDGITAKECLNKIIAVVDPWPLPSKPLVSLTDSEISLMAHNEDEGDWNDLRYRDCWHKGFLDGARAIEDAHGIEE